MRTAIAIGLGSAVGGIFRYFLSSFIQLRSRPGFPYGTLAVNVLGCFAIGVVFSLAERQLISAQWRLYLSTGLIGGFTTFSAFSLETMNLLREAKFVQATIYLTLSLVLGCVASYAGMLIAQR